MEHAHEETPKSPKIKTVHFDEEFAPFLFTKKSEEMSREKREAYRNSLSNGIPIQLKIQNGIEIPFFIKASRSNTSKLWSLTPFNPDAGYQIDKRDLTFEERKQKLRGLMSLGEGKLVALPEAPLWLTIDPVKRDALINVLCNNTGGESKKDEIPQETLDLLKKIRVEASFPNGQFVSEPSLDLPWKDDLGLDVMLDFNSFYPEDTGPLPTTGHLPTREQYDGSYVADILCEKGIAIYLPDDPEKLSQVVMSFFLVDEQEMRKA